jgi:hypothetical protein
MDACRLSRSFPSNGLLSRQETAEKHSSLKHLTSAVMVLDRVAKASFSVASNSVQDAENGAPISADLRTESV